MHGTGTNAQYNVDPTRPEGTNMEIWRGNQKLPAGLWSLSSFKWGWSHRGAAATHFSGNVVTFATGLGEIPDIRRSCHLGPKAAVTGRSPRHDIRNSSAFDWRRELRSPKCRFLEHTSNTRVRHMTVHEWFACKHEHSEESFWILIITFRRSRRRTSFEIKQKNHFVSTNHCYA